MSQVFLKAAYDVLCQVMKPLSIKEITDKAVSYGLLSTQSRAPVKLMQTRINEHIASFDKGSTFIKIGQGRIALREWSFAGHRTKLLYKEKNETIIGLQQKVVDKTGRFFGFSKNFKPYLEAISEVKNLKLQRRRDPTNNKDIKHLVTYVILKNHKGEILTQRRASSSKADSLIKGTLAIAFGGHTNENDIDLFDQAYAGINNCAHREVFEEIKGFRLEKLDIVGVINDDSSPLGYNKFAFVFEGILPKDFDVTKYAKEATITQIKFMKVKDLWGSFHEMEFWSQLVLKDFICKRKRIPTIIKSHKRKFFTGPLIIVGEIGAGKTEITNLLQQRLGATVISMRECICEVLGVLDFGSENRVEFQRRAFELISNPRGVKMLLHNMTQKINAVGNAPIVIDGVRNLKVFNLLKKTLPKCHVMFVEAPRDIAFSFYTNRARNRNVTIEEFRTVRHHDVEKEVAYLKNFADVIVYNSGSLKMLSDKLAEWVGRYRHLNVVRNVS